MGRRTRRPAARRARAVSGDASLTEDFEERIDWTTLDLLRPSVVCVAVSGGADSFALLHLCARRGLPVLALTVNHGLREGSSGEARAVAAWCEAQGIPHETLLWEGEKPESGLQARARRARYRLLVEACARHGSDMLLTGHSADDQAETVFMRLCRGAGRGLSGMWDMQGIAMDGEEPIQLGRPLLRVRREELRAYAKAQGLPFVDDPSNADEHFERVRVRGLLAALEQQDILRKEALCRTAVRVSELRLFGPETDQPEWTEDGAALIIEPVHSPELFDRIVYAVGGGEAVPTDTAERLIDLDSGPVAGVMARVHDADAEEWCLFREPAALLGRADGFEGLPPVPAPPGARRLFDRRFVVHVPEDAKEGTELTALGRLLPRDIALSTLARQRVSTLPCLAREGQITHLPAASIRAVEAAFSGWKGKDGYLSTAKGTFEARSLLAERFAGNVIRF